MAAALSGSRSVSKTASSARLNSSGRTRLTTMIPRGTSSSDRTRSTSWIVSATGISSGVTTTFRAVMAGSSRISPIQPVWVRMGPTVTSSPMASGAPSCATTWPVAGASTTTRSQRARPSIASRTSQQILPTVRISFTPGAAVATKSKALAIGPIRPGMGTFRWRRTYSLSDASVSMAMAHTPGWTRSGRNPTAGRSK
jgi:hypothetical protein